MIETEIRIDAKDAILGLERVEQRAVSTLTGYLRSMGLYAQRAMLLYVHGELQRKIAGPIDVRRTSPITWEVTVGPRGAARWPIYVHEGTGLYRLSSPDFIHARADRGPATVVGTKRPRLMGGKGFLRFVGRGGLVYFRRRVSGMRPNPYVRRAYEKTTIYANAQATRLGREMAQA